MRLRRIDNVADQIVRSRLSSSDLRNKACKRVINMFAIKYFCILKLNSVVAIFNCISI